MILLEVKCLLDDLTLAESRDLIVAVFLVTILLVYFGKCTNRVTVLLKYLDRAFSICGCLMLYNSLTFNLILLSFGKDSFLCLFHLHSNFQLIPPCIIADIGRNF